MSSRPQVALITGAAKRIGAEIGRHLHAANFNLVIHYHQSESDALSLADELNNQRPDSAITIKADLNNQAQLINLATQACEQWQGISVLINNASSFYPTPFGNASEADWDDLIGSNLKAPFFLAQAIAPALTASAGCIINIADIYADRPLRNHNIYSIAKAGNLMLTKSLAQELAPRVRVNGIAPGAILWPEQEDKLSDEDKEKLLNKIPLQQRGQAQDIARAIMFLVKDAPYITGHVLTLDGGRSLTI
jgi:pteridine reductase